MGCSAGPRRFGVGSLGRRGFIPGSAIREDELGDTSDCPVRAALLIAEREAYTALKFQESILHPTEEQKLELNLRSRYASGAGAELRAHIETCDICKRGKG
jgi:hypothetical protein